MPGVRRSALLRAAALAALLGAAGPARAARAQDAADVDIVRPPQSTVVYDRRGGLIGEIGPEARTWVRLIDLPPYVFNAFVAVEDRRFFEHGGVDVVGVLGALRDNLLHGGRPRGASTITQQLIGAMGLVDRRQLTLDRKLREAQLARALERGHTKAEILQAYINWINFGHGWYGVEAAARHYFGKHAKDLTVAEAATLAALPKSPVGYDPRAHADASLRRRNTVLALMLDQHYITQAQYDEAVRQPPHAVPNDGYSVRAPYLVEAVRQWLADRFGLTAVNTSGFQVTTTIDPVLQADANIALTAGLARVESLPGYRWPKYRGPGVSRGETTPYIQGAMVAIDPATGDVLSLIGGRDFRDSEFDRAIQARRQAGSSIKPLVYATAFAHGIRPNVLLADTPFVQELPDHTVWAPQDDDGRFRGMITARTALVSSINIPAIRVAQMVGIDSIIATAHRFGLTTDIPPYLPTAIGAASVEPLEMVSAYGAFATLGTRVPPRYVLEVRDSSGADVYAAQSPVPDSVVDPRIAYQLVNIMQDAVNLGTGTAARRAVGPALPVAGKTGTTNDNADVWFIGMTPNLVAGVWVGFDHPQTITPGAFGGTLAAPIWGDFARAAYASGALQQPAAWQPPPGLVALPVRRATGVPVGPGVTDNVVTEYFLAGTEPTPQGIASALQSRLLWWRP